MGKYKYNPFTRKLDNTGSPSSNSGVTFNEQYTGADATGSNGDANRVLTASGIAQKSGEIYLSVDSQHLRKTTDFTISGNNITFIPKIYDAQTISINYLLGPAMLLEQFTGADGTGSSGDTSRVITTKFLLDAGYNLHVFLNTLRLNRPAQYTLSGSAVTIIPKMFDSDTVDVYFSVGGTIVSQNTGADATGSSGDANRVLTIAGLSSAKGQVMVFIDTQHLRSLDTYTISGNNITFLNKVFDNQKIDAYYIT